MKLALLLPFPRRAATLAALAACLLASPAVSRAADATNETGVHLLEAELLPTKVTLLKVRCDPLVIAVGKTTLAHPEAALAILDAALTRRVRKLHEEGTATLPCTCARRIFLSSVTAAPQRSSDFFELAMELYPDCTAEFADALSEFNAQSKFGDFRAPGDGGFGVGFGPGFPGSPGFTGSSASGALALPPSIVTSVLNG